jgi:hypothetical protein
MSPQPISTPDSSLLPDELRRAQEAIGFPEVQDMLKRLAKYNLGICMPHIHDEERGGFHPLPADTVQLEDDLKVRFVKRDEAERIKAVPVGWQWHDDGVNAMAVCVQSCVIVTRQSGGEDHKRMHSH